MPSNAVPPSVTPPSPNEWLNTVHVVTHISNDRQAIVTSVDHGYSSADSRLTSVMFKQVVGMLPINGLVGVIQDVIDDDRFTVNINSTQFPIYRNSGVVITLTGEPPTERQGFQWGNTPWQNVAITY